MGHLAVQGGQIYYEDYGAGFPIVLCHGVGGNHAIWFRQVATLSAAYRVICFDHRGFGNSKDDAGEGRAAFVRDMIDLLDHLEIPKAALIGQSMGGGTCLATAALHPDRVAALVLASSLHAFHEITEIGPIMAAAREETENLAQLDRVLSDTYRKAQPDEALLYAMISSFNRVGRRNLVGEWPTLVNVSEIDTRKMPLMFIAGSLDRLFPVTAIRAIQAQITGSLLVEIDGAGHSAFFERPVEFNDSVLSFMAMCGLKPCRSAFSNSPGYKPPGP